MEQPALSVFARPYAVSKAQARTSAENIALSLSVFVYLQHNQQTSDTQRVFRGRQRVLTLSAVPYRAIYDANGNYARYYR